MILPLLVFTAACLGAISGLGGGVFFIPIFVSLLPGWEPASLAALSVMLVLLNAGTALFLGGQVKNVDWSFAKSMALLSCVGAAIGVYLQSFVSREAFELSLAVFLFLLGIFVLWRSGHADVNVAEYPEPFDRKDGSFSVLVGMTASFFGLGGGVLQMPYMVYYRRRAVRQATATSQVILSVSGLMTLFLFLAVRQVPVPWINLLYCAPAVVAGGFLGSKLALGLRGPWIVRILAVTLLFMAYRLAS